MPHFRSSKMKCWLPTSKTCFKQNF